MIGREEERGGTRSSNAVPDPLVHFLSTHFGRLGPGMTGRNLALCFIFCCSVSSHSPLTPCCMIKFTLFCVGASSSTYLPPPPALLPKPMRTLWPADLGVIVVENSSSMASLFQ